MFRVAFGFNPGKPREATIFYSLETPDRAEAQRLLDVLPTLVTQQIGDPLLSSGMTFGLIQVETPMGWLNEDEVETAQLIARRRETE